MTVSRARFAVFLSLAGLSVGFAVIPAGAQVAPPQRGGGNDDGAPAYVDNADRQPYYVDGVEYRPYVPQSRQDSRKSKPAAAAAPQSEQPVTPNTGEAPATRPYVAPTANAPAEGPPTSIVASAAPGAAPQSASSSVSAAASASASNMAPLKRPRYAVAVIQALDKVTAETIRFEAPIGKPVRYKGLIYTARACETTAADEAAPDVMAYLEVRTNPVAATSNSPAVRSREIFHGWSFASAPSLNPIEHPNYDAWVIGCRQPLPGV
jgi:hypothetical protein